MRISPRSWLLLTLAAFLVPEAVLAQRWAPVSIGARVGFDNKQRQEVVGAQLHIPVVRDGRVEIMPNADVTFLPISNDYQLNLEAVYVLGDQAGGGLYAGGGVGLRSFVLTGPRETATTFSLVAGIKLTGLGRVVPQAEFRWVFIDELLVDPQQVTIGASFQLWSRPRPGLAR